MGKDWPPPTKQKTGQERNGFVNVAHRSALGPNGGVVRWANTADGMGSVGIDERMKGKKGGRMEGRMHGWMDGWLDVC